MRYLEQPASPTSGNWLNKVYDEMLVNLLSSHLTNDYLLIFKDAQDSKLQKPSRIICTD